MKKYIKSILALATAALLGSSAWAGFTASPSTVSVAVGETKTVTISSTESSDRTLAMGTNSESSNPYTKNTYFDAKLVNSSGTATLTIPRNGSLTLQITGKTQTSSAQTFTIYRNGKSTSCSVTITVTAAPVAKTVEVDKSITLDTETFAGRYYYKLVGDGDATDYVTLSPTAETRSQSSTYKTGTMTVTGKKATTSPVTVRVQTNSRTSTGGTYTDVKVYSITVTEPAPIDGTVTKTIDVSKSVDVTTSVAVDSAKTQISPSGLATVTYSGDKKTMTIKGGSSENSGTIKFYNSNGALVLVVNLTVNDPSKLKLNVSEIETFVFPTGGATWGAKSSSQNITANGSTANNQYTLTIGSTQDKGAGSDQSGTVTVTSNNVTVLTINVTALKDNDWGESTHPDAPAVKKLTVYVGKSLVREYHIATKCAYGREETNPDSAITVAYNPVCETTFTVPTGFDSSMRKTASTVNDFSMTITGSKIGTAGIKILYGGSNPARWAGNYTVEVRDVLTGTPTATGLDYGDTLSASTISGTMKDSKGATVSGTWAWVNPSTVPAAGKNKYPAKFTATGTNAQYYDEYECEIQVTVTNPLTPVAVPTANNLTYNGNEQTGVAAGTGYTLTGTTKATDAGNYTAYATPASGYCWKDDGTTDQKTINWSIARAKSAVEPTKATGLTYNGAEQFGYTAAGANVTLDGTTSATNVNNYTFTATPTANYAWGDGTFAAKTYNWSIGYKQATVTVVDTNKLAGAAEPIYRTTTTGFVAGDTTELTWTAFRTNASETVGTYDVVVVGEEQQGGYQITYNKGTLTIKNGVVTVNGKAYLDVAAAFADLKASGGQAVFNEAVTDYNGYAFAKDTTIDYDKDTGACRVTGEMTAPQVKAEEDIAVNGTLTLTGDIYVGATGASRTLVAATNVVLGANVTVGKESEGATDMIAVLTFEEINVGAFKLTLTTNGVVRSATALDTDAVFTEVEHFHVAKKTIADGFEYTLEATEFYVKYYDGDEVVYSNKFTILNYMTDLHVWDGTRDGLVLIGYTREDKTTKLDATDAALRDYVKDEADDPGCDGEVKVFGTWEQKIIPVNVPTAVTGLIYDGNEQTGVVENVGYTLTNNAKTDAGDYTATATLADGYIWDDGSSDPTNINWSIAAAKLTIGGVEIDPANLPTPPGPESEDASATGVANVIKTYDGEATNVVVSATAGATVKFSADDKATWTEAGSFADFTNAGTNKVWYAVEAANYLSVTNYAYVTINPLAITVTPDAGQEKTAGEAYTITFTTNVTMIGTDHFTGALAPADDTPGEQDIVLGTLAIDDGNGGKNYEITLASETITVKAAVTPVAVPTAVAGLVYNGNEQTGVVENVGYTLTNNAKTDAGSYTATATLADGYIWDDGSSDPTNINWSIAAAKLTSASAASQTWTGSKLIPVVVAKAGEVVATTADFDVGTWDPDGLTDVGKYTAKVTGKRNFTGEVDVEFEIIEQKQEVEPGKTTKVIPEKVPTTPEEIAAAEADALNKVKVVITDEDAKSAGQEDIVKEVAKYNSETKTVDVTLAIDTNSENYVEMDNAITDISTNLEDVVSGESSALKIPADEVTPGLYYNVIVEDENGNVTTGECALATSEGGVNLPVPEIDPNVTGLYFTVEQHLLKDGSDEGVVSKTLGYLGKEPTETEATIRDFVGAPWGGMMDSEEIAVENFVKTENLKEGTKLYSYDEGKDAYNAWELDENKSWKPIKTYMMADGKLTEQETKTADTAKIKRGTGAWIEHVKLDKKFVFVGDATRSEVAVPTTEGYNALSAKNFESLDLNDTLLEGASSKDSIIIPQAGSVPLVCTLKDGKWGYDSFTETEKKIGGQVQKVHTNTRVTNIKIPAGSAFWYVRGKTAK